MTPDAQRARDAAIAKALRWMRTNRPDLWRQFLDESYAELGVEHRRPGRPPSRRTEEIAALHALEEDELTSIVEVYVPDRDTTESWLAFDRTPEQRTKDRRDIAGPLFGYDA